MKSQGKEFTSGSKYTAVMESLQNAAKSRDKSQENKMHKLKTWSSPGLLSEGAANIDMLRGASHHHAAVTPKKSLALWALHQLVQQGHMHLVAV